MGIDPIAEYGEAAHIAPPQEISVGRAETAAPFSTGAPAKDCYSPDDPRTRTQTIATQQFTFQTADRRTAARSSNNWIKTISADPAAYAKYVKIEAARTMYMKSKDKETEQERAYWGHLHIQFKSLIAEIKAEKLKL